MKKCENHYYQNFLVSNENAFQWAYQIMIFDGENKQVFTIGKIVLKMGTLYKTI